MLQEMSHRNVHIPLHSEANHERLCDSMKRWHQVLAFLHLCRVYAGQQCHHTDQQ